MRQLRSVADHLVVAFRIGKDNASKTDFVAELLNQIQCLGIGEDRGQDHAGTRKQICRCVLIAPAFSACHRMTADKMKVKCS